MTSPKSKKFKYKAVEVAWVDSEHNADWATLSEILEGQTSLECRSIGYLIADKADRVVLATSVTASEEVEDDAVSAYITIPKQAILWIKEQRPVATKKKIANIE